MIIVQLTLPASAYRVGYVTVAAMRTVHIADHDKGAGRATTSVRLLPSETVIGSAKGPDHQPLEAVATMAGIQFRRFDCKCFKCRASFSEYAAAIALLSRRS
jgi:hypothetical protein